MTYFDPELDKVPSDRIWALEEAAKPCGMTPHSKAVAGFIRRLELDGLLHESQRRYVWCITNAGRAELARLKAEASRDQQRPLSEVK